MRCCGAAAHFRTNIDMSNETPSPGNRLWIPVLTLMLGAAAIWAVQIAPELERNLKGWFTGGIVVLTGATLLFWFLFLSRLSILLRLIVAALLAIGAMALKQNLMVQGTEDGTGRPHFVWKSNAGKGPEFRPTPKLGTAPADALQTAALTTGAESLQFLGSARTGAESNARWSRDWKAAAPRELWRQSVGAGWSAFAVFEGHAITQEQRGEHELVTCYDLLTGAWIWGHTNQARFSQWQGGDGPRATPTVAGGRVYTYGATGLLNAIDARTGRNLWSRDVLRENDLPNLIWGASASPLVFDSTVVVTGGLTNRATVLAFRADTGQPLWKSGEDKASYASPILATLGGRRYVLSVNAASITAHDVTTGAVAWNHPWAKDNWPKASQPIVLEGDRVFVSAGYGVGCMLLQLQFAADGKITATELWRNKMMKTQFNSAAVRNGFVYGLDDGLLACVEIATGQRKWKDGRSGSGQSLLIEDTLVVQTEPGDVFLAAATPDGFSELGRLPALKSKTWNFPTVAGRYLLARNDQEAVCYELPQTAAK